MSKTAIILGASGLVGNEVLQQLLIDPEFSTVKLFVRKSLSIENSKLQQHIINFEVPQNYSNLIKADIIFCCLGTTIKIAGSQDAFKRVDYAYPLEFAKVAKQNGCENFIIISSLGADKNSSNFYLKTKGEIENALGQLKFKSLIILRPSMLLGNRKEFRFGELIGKALMKTLSFLFIGKLKKYKAIEASKVAKAMIVLSKMNLVGESVFESDRLQILGK